MKNTVILFNALILSALFLFVSCGGGDESDNLQPSDKNGNLQAEIPPFSVPGLKSANTNNILNRAAETDSEKLHEEADIIDCDAAVKLLNDAAQLVQPSTTGYLRADSLIKNANSQDCDSRRQIRELGYTNYQGDPNKFISSFDYESSSYYVGWEVSEDIRKGALINLQNLKDENGEPYEDKSKFTLDMSSDKKESFSLYMNLGIDYVSSFHIIETVNNGNREHKISSRVWSGPYGIIEYYAHMIENVGAAFSQKYCDHPDTTKLEYESTCAESFTTTYFGPDFTTAVEANSLNELINKDPTAMEEVKTTVRFIENGKTVDDFYKEKYFQ